MSIHISVVEYGVFNYPHPDMAHDEKGWGGWHFMRVEYHDSEEAYAFDERHVWMPPGTSSAVLEDWMNKQLKADTVVLSEENEMTTDATLNPGTKEAIDAGCICPVIDNDYGQGYMGQENVFIYVTGCPVHLPEDILGELKNEHP